jgi:hypothetical protein
MSQHNRKINHKWIFGEARIKQALARRTKGVVGNKGKTIPIMPNNKKNPPKKNHRIL